MFPFLSRLRSYSPTQAFIKSFDFGGRAARLAFGWRVALEGGFVGGLHWKLMVHRFLSVSAFGSLRRARLPSEGAA